MTSLGFTMSAGPRLREVLSEPQPKEETSTLERDFHDRFVKLRDLAQGGQAETHLARDEDTQQVVVVKRLNLATAHDWKAVELFEREARVLGKLDHPSIPDLVGAYVLEGTGEPTSFMLVQRYVEGETLAEILDHRVVDEAEALRIARDVLEVLAYLHGRNPPVVHRDIKPSNLVRRPDGGISVIDFGALQTVRRSATTVGSTIIGTPGFVAPEQMMGRAVPASDLYGLGATLLQMLSGRHPSDLPSEGLRLDFAKDVAVSPALAGFLGRLLAPSLDERFCSASEALAVLSALPANGTPTAAVEVIPSTLAGPVDKPSPRRHTRLLAAVGLTSLLLLASLWFGSTYALERDQGTIRIDLTPPPPDARVYVDGELACVELPCDAGPYEPGTYRVRIEAPGRPTKQEDVVVTAGGMAVLRLVY